MKKPRQKSRPKKPITAQDLFRLRVPTALTMAPDEKRIAYTVEQIDEEDKTYYAHLHVCNLGNHTQQQFTHGKVADSQPAWSPDGDMIAFVSTRDKKTGIYLISVSGGSERRVIELDGTIDGLQWHPDGKHLVFNLRYNDSHHIEDEKAKKEPPVCRHITRLWNRLDGFGYLPQDRFQVYALHTESGKLRKITRGKRDNVNVKVSPDGRWVAYISNRRRNPDVDLMYWDLFVIPFKGGAERRIPTPPGPIDTLAFSPDSKVIVYVGHDRPDSGWGAVNYHIWKVGLRGSPKARDLMPGFDRTAYDVSITDIGDMSFSTPIWWSSNGKRIFFLSSDTGVTNLFSVRASGGKPTRIFRGNCHLKAAAFNGKTRTAALIHADLRQPGEIVTCPAAPGGEKKAVRHTDLNPFLRTDVQLGKTREVRFRSFDGTRVQGWLVTPPGFKRQRKYPSILEIHGGPRVQYAHTFFHEMQFLAARGYVVFYTNPRGGAGRGETWAEAIKASWGGLDYQDCMAAADYLERQPFINPKKMGVTGGSYGGYMTNWLIGHTDRFKAAVTQRSVVDLKSMYGSSDMGWSFEIEFDGKPWDSRDRYDQCSPITYFKKVRTPVLIIHSEQDLRCNIEQAQQMFVMLKRLGKKVEMVQFPGEPHGLSRHGRPDRRICRLEWIDKWFGKYLK